MSVSVTSPEEAVLFVALWVLIVYQWWRKKRWQSAAEFWMQMYELEKNKSERGD